MDNTHQIIQQVNAAKNDMRRADSLIRAYIPFIRSETSKFINRICTGEEDEFSIGMIAFHEAIRSYSEHRGAFLNYAAMVIRSRLTDWRRKEARHTGQVSIYEETGEDEISIHEHLADSRNRHEERAGLAATKEEIRELAAVMAQFGVSFTDIAENSPKQERTLDACKKAIQYAGSNPRLLDELLKTKKLPLAALVKGSGAERKTLERHRKYILAMLLIQTNGYEIVRGHLRHILKPKGGVSA